MATFSEDALLTWLWAKCKYAVAGHHLAIPTRAADLCIERGWLRRHLMEGSEVLWTTTVTEEGERAVEAYMESLGLTVVRT